MNIEEYVAKVDNLVKDLCTLSQAAATLLKEDKDFTMSLNTGVCVILSIAGEIHIVSELGTPSGLKRIQECDLKKEMTFDKEDKE